MTNEFEIGKLQSYYSNIFGPLQDRSFIIINGTIYKMPLTDEPLSTFYVKLEIYLT